MPSFESHKNVDVSDRYEIINLDYTCNKSLRPTVQNILNYMKLVENRVHTYKLHSNICCYLVFKDPHPLENDISPGNFTSLQYHVNRNQDFPTRLLQTLGS